MTADCCAQNAPRFGCNQGRDCPLRVVSVAQAARSCESMGVCQHPERECTGACDLPPALPAAPKAAGRADALAFWTVVFALSLISAALIVSGIVVTCARWPICLRWLA